MSIDRMEHVVMLVPAGAGESLVEWLYGEREVHLKEFQEVPAGWRERFRALEKDNSLAEGQVTRLEGSTRFLREYTKDKASFLESFFPVRILASSEEIGEAAKAVDPEKLLSECEALRAEIESNRDERESLATELDRLRELAFLRVSLERLRVLRSVALRLVAASSQAARALPIDERLGEKLAAVVLDRAGTSTIFALAAPVSAAGLLQEVIADYGLREIPLPPIEGTVAEEMASLRNNLERASVRQRELRQRAEELAVQWAHKAELALAYWESERSRLLKHGLMVSSRNVFAAGGYMRARRIEGFRRRLEQAFPGSALVLHPGPEGEEPPVSVTWNRFFRPAGLLVKMFGLPSYRSLDPTAYLMFTFLAFFGICYGDVLYGLMLITVAELLKRRFRNHRGLVEFFRLFTYAGVSTVIVGVATGSWAADLPAYFGQNNPVEILRRKLTLLEPLAKPVLALAIAIGIGVANQLYGIFLRTVRDWRKGDGASAFYDGVLWIGYLTGLIMLFITLFGWGPKSLGKAALALLAPCALGLILTQGREQKGWFARIVLGFFSLYGVVGTYGTSPFVGDVLSYSRLLALGLTTSIVGMSFNIIGNLVRGIPVVGMLLFPLVIVLGHGFNFAMSILSAFVHSARLILLEFFGRFYEGGGVPFQPFGFQSSRVEILPD